MSIKHSFDVILSGIRKTKEKLHNQHMTLENVVLSAELSQTDNYCVYSSSVKNTGFAGNSERTLSLLESGSDS